MREDVEAERLSSRFFATRLKKGYMTLAITTAGSCQDRRTGR